MFDVGNAPNGDENENENEFQMKLIYSLKPHDLFNLLLLLCGEKYR